MIIEKNALINKYGVEKSNTLEEYLRCRYDSIRKKRMFNVVYDLLHQCDIRCLGCGTNASWTADTSIKCTEMSLKQIETVLIKIKEYSIQTGLTPFINYGGGEPFLRDDIVSILKLSAEILGSDSIGIDTNASLPQSYELISDIVPYVSYIGVSINGLEEYHNWWSNNCNINAYANATTVLKKLCCDKCIASKIEVTTVATKKNYRTLHELMTILKDIGVENYSIHRAIPMGRMHTIQKSMILDADEYLELLIDVIYASKCLSLNAHFHHSIESIYASLLFGINTYDTDKVVNNNYRSSISIDPLLSWIECDTVVIRSTVPVGFTAAMSSKFNKDIVFQPEYYGETNAHPFSDLNNQNWISLGGSIEAVNKVVNFYQRHVLSEIHFYIADSKTVELAKYMTNTFLATKVVFCNEMYDLAVKLGINYNVLREIWLADPRIGRSHTFVYPEERGFGGSCFPKDSAALLSLGENVGADMTLLRSVIEKNEKLHAPLNDNEI